MRVHDLPVLMGANIVIVMMRNVDDPDDGSGDARLVKPLSCINIARYFNSEIEQTERSEEKRRKNTG